MGFLLALQFLTRVPITIRRNIDVKDMARSMAYFPLVGAVLGVAAALLYSLLSMFLAPAVCDVLVLLFFVMVTGNMHLDGLMDTADGYLSGKPKERVLEIMKDSRVGSHGVVAGIFIVALKLALLSQLVYEAKIAALIIMPLVGRWAQVYGARYYTYARTSGGKSNFTDFVGRREIIIASIIALLVVMPILQINGLYLLITAFSGTFLLAWCISSKIGGMTGDTLGALTELVEILVLFFFQFIMLSSFVLF